MLAAICITQPHLNGWAESPEVSSDRGLDYARRAVRAAGNDPFVLASAAAVFSFFGGDITAALALVDRSLAELLPLPQLASVASILNFGPQCVVCLRSVSNNETLPSELVGLVSCVKVISTRCPPSVTTNCRVPEAISVAPLESKLLPLQEPPE